MKLPWPLLVLKDWFICIIIAAILGVAILTVPLPTPLGAQTIGTYQLVAFPSGFALYQPVSGSHFYSMSPLDDFVVDSHGNKSVLANLNQLQTDHPRLTDTKISSLKNVEIALQNYFGQSEMTFSNPNGLYPATYSAQLQKNALIITRQVTNQKNEAIVQAGMTVKYDQDDFVFDQNGHNYLDKTPAEIALFNQFYGEKLLQPLSLTDQIKNNPDLSPMPVSQITIANPKLAGLLVVTATSYQHLWINRASGTIEVVENVLNPTASIITSSLKVYVVHHPNEVLP